MTETQAPAPGSLILSEPNRLGAALGLRAGDRLIAVNGLPIPPEAAALNTRIGPAGRAAALSMERAGRVWIVLSDSPHLGRWRPGPAPIDRPEDPKGRIRPEGLRNWEILRAPDGRYDIQPVALPLLALIAPPLWLMQTRLWAGLAVWGALVLVGVPLGWPAVLALHAIASVYFWKSGPALWRTDRFARGLRPDAVMAAASETALHERIRELHPGAVYLHLPAHRIPDEMAEAA